MLQTLRIVQFIIAIIYYGEVNIEYKWRVETQMQEIKVGRKDTVFIDVIVNNCSKLCPQTLIQAWKRRGNDLRTDDNYFTQTYHRYGYSSYMILIWVIWSCIMKTHHMSRKKVVEAREIRRQGWPPCLIHRAWNVELM